MQVTFCKKKLDYLRVAKSWFFLSFSLFLSSSNEQKKTEYLRTIAKKYIQTSEVQISSPNLFVS